MGAAFQPRKSDIAAVKPLPRQKDHYSINPIFQYSMNAAETQPSIIHDILIQLSKKVLNQPLGLPLLQSLIGMPGIVALIDDLQITLVFTG